MNELTSLVEPGSPALVISPHPDDETFGCGGFIALSADAGKEVHSVFCTDGEAIERHAFDPPLASDFDLAGHRKEETARAAKILGAGESIYLSFPDGDLFGHLEELAQSLRNCFSTRKPSLVLAPWPGEKHADHVATSWAAAKAAVEAGITLAFYEVNTPLCPTTWVDIEGVLERKRQAIMVYHYSLYGKPDVFWTAISGLNAYRSFYLLRKGFQETFFLPKGQANEVALGQWIQSPPRWDPGCSVASFLG